jgi:hypothetical protein
MFVLLQIVAPGAEKEPPFQSCPMIELTEGVPGEFISTKDDPKRHPKPGDYRLEATVYGKPEGSDGISLTVDVQLERHGVPTLLLYDDPTIQSGGTARLKEGNLSIVVYAWRGPPDAAGLTKAKAECEGAPSPAPPAAAGPSTP